MIEKVDFLVIGAGSAGLSTAIQLQKYGKVLVIAKKTLEDASSNWAAGGVAATGPWIPDFNTETSYEAHVADTLEAGDGLCKEESVRFIVKHGTDRIQNLIDWGLQFDVHEETGEFDLGREGGHHIRRILHTKDETGKSILHILIKKAQELPNIEIRINQYAINLIEQKGQCIGCYVLNNANQDIYAVQSKAVILASGGTGKAYAVTSNPDVATGDGIAMAWRIGASIANMEMIQFHPTCLYHPYAKNSLISEALRGEGAILKDKDGHRFMEGVHPLKELAPRDIVARAIDKSLKQTGDNCVYLDISFKDPAYLRNRFPAIYTKCKEFGVDITKEAIPIVPAAHYCMGGVLAEINGTTNVPRLYAVGETSCTGLHGANRLASNSLLECLVAGYECGNYVGKKYQEKSNGDKVLEWKTPSNMKEPTEKFIVTSNWNEIRATMQAYVSIIRSNMYLMRARKRITMIHEDVDEYYWDFRITSDLIELRNLLTVARLITESALARKESRGAHYTIDYPNKAEIIRNTIMKQAW